MKKVSRTAAIASAVVMLAVSLFPSSVMAADDFGGMGGMDWSQMGNMDWSQFGGGDMGGMDWSQFGGGDMGGNTDWSGFSGGNGDNPDIQDAVFDDTTNTKVSLYGDVNKDGTISASDCSALCKYLLGITSEKNGEMDVNKDGNVNIVDYITLISAVLGETEIEQPQQSQQDEGGATTSPADFLAKFKASLTNNVPSSATQKNSHYKMEKITYFSKAANKNKPANVLLPEGYSTNEKYPVFVCTHGIMGNQDSMIGSDMKVVDMAGNLMNSGEAKKMIIVFPDMFTSKTMNGPSGIDQATCAAYDNFAEDVTGSLLPYIYEHYSAKEGRDFTAISGFSMGGREALYCGIKYPEVFGYVGAACPAPGITKSRDMFMEHPGTMSESQVKIDPAPYLLFITGGTNDQVVGTFPSEYSNMFKQNGQDHAYQTIQGGGHGGECVVPHMYNFLKAIFQA